MTLPFSGILSMTAIANEAKVARSAANLNDSTLRTLANKPGAGSIIKYSDFYGKTKTGTSFTINADYLMVTIDFSDGSDIDIRARVVVPATPVDYIGYSYITTNIGNYIFYGGDNVGTGLESALINVANLKTALGATGVVKIDVRARWYNTPGLNPVKLRLTAWEGGSPVSSFSLKSWTNPTAVNTIVVESIGKVVTALSTGPDPGDRLGIVSFDLTTGSGYIDETDTTNY